MYLFFELNVIGIYGIESCCKKNDDELESSPPHLYKSKSCAKTKITIITGTILGVVIVGLFTGVFIFSNKKFDTTNTNIDEDIALLTKDMNTTNSNITDSISYLNKNMTKLKDELTEIISGKSETITKQLNNIVTNLQSTSELVSSETTDIRDEISKLVVNEDSSILLTGLNNKIEESSEALAGFIDGKFTDITGDENVSLTSLNTSIGTIQSNINSVGDRIDGVSNLLTYKDSDTTKNKVDEIKTYLNDDITDKLDGINNLLTYTEDEIIYNKVDGIKSEIEEIKGLLTYTKDEIIYNKVDGIKSEIEEIKGLLTYTEDNNDRTILDAINGITKDLKINSNALNLIDNINNDNYDNLPSLKMDIVVPVDEEIDGLTVKYDLLCVSRYCIIIKKKEDGTIQDINEEWQTVTCSGNWCRVDGDKECSWVAAKSVIKCGVDVIFTYLPIGLVDNTPINIHYLDGKYGVTYYANRIYNGANTIYSTEYSTYILPISNVEKNIYKEVANILTT